MVRYVSCKDCGKIIDIHKKDYVKELIKLEYFCKECFKKIENVLQ